MQESQSTVNSTNNIDKDFADMMPKVRESIKKNTYANGTIVFLSSELKTCQTFLENHQNNPENTQYQEDIQALVLHKEKLESALTTKLETAIKAFEQTTEISQLIDKFKNSSPIASAVKNFPDLKLAEEFQQNFFSAFQKIVQKSAIPEDPFATLKIIQEVYHDHMEKVFSDGNNKAEAGVLFEQYQHQLVDIALDKLSANNTDFMIGLPAYAEFNNNRSQIKDLILTTAQQDRLNGMITDFAKLIGIEITNLKDINQLLQTGALNNIELAISLLPEAQASSLKTAFEQKITDLKTQQPGIQAAKISLEAIANNPDKSPVQKLMALSQYMGNYDALFGNMPQAITDQYASFSEKLNIEISSSLLSHSQTLIKNFDVNELTRDGANKSVEDAQKSPTISAYINNGNQLSAGVIASIVENKNSTTAVLMAKQWMNIAAKNLEHGDFHTAFTIVSALNNPTLTKVMATIQSAKPADYYSQLWSVFSSLAINKVHIGRLREAIGVLEKNKVLIPSIDGYLNQVISAAEASSEAIEQNNIKIKTEFADFQRRVLSQNTDNQPALALDTVFGNIALQALPENSGTLILAKKSYFSQTQTSLQDLKKQDSKDNQFLTRFTEMREHVGNGYYFGLEPLKQKKNKLARAVTGIGTPEKIEAIQALNQQTKEFCQKLATGKATQSETQAIIDLYTNKILSKKKLHKGKKNVARLFNNLAILLEQAKKAGISEFSINNNLLIKIDQIRDANPDKDFLQVAGENVKTVIARPPTDDPPPRPLDMPMPPPPSYPPPPLPEVKIPAEHQLQKTDLEAYSQPQNFTLFEKARFQVSLAYNKARNFPESNQILSQLQLGRIPENNQVPNKTGLIVSVVTMAEMAQVNFDFNQLSQKNPPVKHLQIVMTDFGSAVPTAVAINAISQIHQSMQAGESIYVHCKAGRARSAMMLTALLAVAARDFKKNPGIIDQPAYKAYKEFFIFIQQDSNYQNTDQNINNDQAYFLVAQAFLKQKRSTIGLDADQQATALSIIGAFKGSLMTPDQATHDAYFNHLKNQYDFTQLPAYKALMVYGIQHPEKRAEIQHVLSTGQISTENTAKNDPVFAQLLRAFEADRIAFKKNIPDSESPETTLADPALYITSLVGDLQVEDKNNPYGYTERHYLSDRKTNAVGTDNRLEVRVFNQDSYNGPKTEDFLRRAESLYHAACKMLKENTSLFENQKTNIQKELDKKLIETQKIIKEKASIDSNIMKKNNSESFQHYNQQREVALTILQALVTDNICIIHQSKTPDMTKAIQEYKKQEAESVAEKGRAKLVHIYPVADQQRVSMAEPQGDHTNPSTIRNKPEVSNFVKVTAGYLDSTGKFHKTFSAYRHSSYPPIKIKGDSIAQKMERRAGAVKSVKNVLTAIVKNMPELGAEPIEINLATMMLLTALAKDQKIMGTASEMRQLKDSLIALNMLHGQEITLDIDGKRVRVKPNLTQMNVPANTVMQYQFKKLGGEFNDSVNNKGFSEFRENFLGYINSDAQSAEIKQLLQPLTDLCAIKISPEKQASLQAGQSNLMQLYKALAELQTQFTEPQKCQAYQAKLAEIRQQEKKLAVIYKEITREQKIAWKQAKEDIIKLKKAVNAKLEDKNLSEKDKKTLAITQLFINAAEIFYQGAHKDPQNGHQLQARYVLANEMMGKSVEFFCKSGEDRTGRLNNHIEEFLVFYQKNNRFPEFSNTADTEQLIAISQAVNMGSVSKKITDQNAPGAEGLQQGNDFGTNASLHLAELDRQNALLAKSVYKMTLPQKFMNNLRSLIRHDETKLKINNPVLADHIKNTLKNGQVLAGDNKSKRDLPEETKNEINLLMAGIQFGDSVSVKWQAYLSVINPVVDNENGFLVAGLMDEDIFRIAMLAQMPLPEKMNFQTEIDQLKKIAPDRTSENYATVIAQHYETVSVLKNKIDQQINSMQKYQTEANLIGDCEDYKQEQKTILASLAMINKNMDLIHQQSDQLKRLSQQLANKQNEIKNAVNLELSQAKDNVSNDLAEGAENENKLLLGGPNAHTALMDDSKQPPVVWTIWKFDEDQQKIIQQPETQTADNIHTINYPHIRETDNKVLYDPGEEGYKDDMIEETVKLLMKKFPDYKNASELKFECEDKVVIQKAEKIAERLFEQKNLKNLSENKIENVANTQNDIANLANSHL